MRARAAGYSRAVEQTAGPWSEGVADGLVAGDAGGALLDLLGIRSRSRAGSDLAGISPDILLAIAGRVDIPPALATLYDLELWAALSAAANAASQSVAAADYVERLEQVARDFGLDGEPERGMLAIEDEVVGPEYRTALQEFRRLDEVLLVNPYLQYHSALKPTTRNNHRVLHGFVWRPGDRVERVVLPPNGWNCLCRAVPVGHREAARLGWDGDYPVGLGPLEDFLALGGPDAKFPKGEFV